MESKERLTMSFKIRLRTRSHGHRGSHKHLPTFLAKDTPVKTPIRHSTQPYRSTRYMFIHLRLPNRPLKGHHPNIRAFEYRASKSLPILEVFRIS